MVSMEKDNIRILVLSSCSPASGPAIIGAQIYDALKRKGVEVDFMTKYPESSHSEYLWVIKNNFFNRLFYGIRNKIRWLLVGGAPKQGGHLFYYTYESKPPIPSRLVVKAVKKQYDIVLIVFWQRLLSFDTIDRLFDKLHCQFHFMAVDFSPMSGGCHFTGNCQKYQTGCGMCPAFHSTNPNDFTAQNISFRKAVYNKVKPIIYGNAYLQDFFDRSVLLKNVSRVILNAPIVNTDIFRPIDKKALRQKYHISDNKKYIVFFGSQYLNDERKGINYLLDAFEYLNKQLGEESEHVLVITAGTQYEALKDHIPFDSIGMGYVSMNVLPELYSLSTLFVSPSVDDAGPMMVNQSLCCGTPVVGFDMGAVKQVVKDKGTGVCVPLRDSQALAEGMLYIIRLSVDDYNEMSLRAREIAIMTSSYEAQADLVIRTYEKFKAT